MVAGALAGRQGDARFVSSSMRASRSRHAPCQTGPRENSHKPEEGIGGSQGQGECANATWLDRTPCSQFTPRRWASAFRWSAKPTAR